MKATIQVLIALLVFYSSYGQCVPNGEFAQWNCGTQNDQLILDNCLTGWLRSHGTPQVFTNSNSTANIAFMWASGDDGRCRGEGIYAPFTFRKGYTYRAVIKYTIDFSFQSPPLSPTPEIRLIAAQDIRRPSRWKTGNLIPLTTREQRIATIAATPGWKTSSVYTFTASDNYNQFWIYPYYTAEWTQVNFYLDWVSVCEEECTSDLYYSSGVLPTTDSKAGNKFIGSTYGISSSPVTINGSALTTVTAANSIVMSPEFNATVSSGSFLAQILPCSPSYVYNTRQASDTVDVTQFPLIDTGWVAGGTYEDEYGVPEPKTNRLQIDLQTEEKFVTGFKVYPNPANSILNITSEVTNNNSFSIKLINTSGMIIRTYRLLKGNLQLSISDLPNGTYFVQLVDEKGNSKTKKFIKL